MSKDTTFIGQYFFSITGEFIVENHYLCVKHQYFYLWKKVNRLRTVHAEKGKTEKWLGERLDKGPVTVLRWCQNKMQRSISTFARIAEILDVEISDLFTKKIVPNK